MNVFEYIMFSIFRLSRRLRLSRTIRTSTPTRRFTDYFKNFEKVEAVKEIFGEKTEEVLRNLKIDFMSFGGYMGVDDTNGHLMVNARYMNSGDKVDIYLDVIHELCHVKQLMDGKKLFDSRYEYVERPTEIEAYLYTVQEARRLGLNDERICQYLKTEWMSDNDLKRLANTLDVRC